MVGAIGAIDARGPAELGDYRHHRLAPHVAHILLRRRERAIERAEQCRQPAAIRAFVDVRVPSVKGERPDARTIVAGEEFRRGACRIGEERAHLRGETLRQCAAFGRRHHGRIACGRKHCEIAAPFQHTRQLDVGVMIEIKQPRHRVFARRLDARRRP